MNPVFSTVFAVALGAFGRYPGRGRGPRACCYAFNARCLAACAGVSEEEYCRMNPNVPGCEEDLCANKNCGDVCANSNGMLMVMRYCQPDGSCGMDANPQCEPEEPYNCYTRERWSQDKRDYCCAEYGLGCPSVDLCANKSCGDVCDNKQGMLMVMRYCQADGSCTSNAAPQCQPEEDLCANKACGDVCDTSNGMLAVMRYCQADGSCGMNSAPQCQPAHYNCWTRERWTSDKRAYCCDTWGLGCPTWGPWGGN